MAALFQMMQNHRQRRVFRQRTTFKDVRDVDFESNYRLDRQQAENLADLLAADLSSGTQRSKAIPVETKVLIGLRYLAKGDFLSELASIHGVSKACAASVVADFVDSVNQNLTNIRFPLEREDIDNVKLGFYRRCRIPNVVGAVDGTLVPILAPTTNPDIYICRKGYHALNIQAVVDSNMRFIDAVCKWPGSQHDAAIFDSCGLKEHLETSNIGHLLGDSGYPLRHFLLTPVASPSRANEVRFNKAHGRGRVVIEKAFGILKARFRCLHKSGGCLQFNPTKSAQVVIACMRLHNLCIDAGLPLPDIPESNDHVDDDNMFDENSDNEYRQKMIDLF